MKMLVLLLIAVCACSQEKSEPPAVQIYVGEHKELTIMVPRVAKENLVSIASEFFARNRKDMVPKLEKTLSGASDVTLVLTSK